MRFKFNSTKTAVKIEFVNGKPHFIDTKGGHWALSVFTDDPESAGNARRDKDQLSPVGHDGGYHPEFEGKTNLLRGYDIDPEKNKLKINRVAPSTGAPVKDTIKQRPRILPTPMISELSYTRDAIEKIKDEESKVNSVIKAYKSIVVLDNDPFRSVESYQQKKDDPLPLNFIDKINPFRPVRIVTVHLPGTHGPQRYYLGDFDDRDIEERYPGDKEKGVPGIQRLASPETLEKYSKILKKIIRTPALEDRTISNFLDTSTIKPGHVITVRHNYPGSSFHHPVIDAEGRYYILDHVHPGIEAAYPGIQRLGRKEIIGLKQHMQSNGEMHMALDNNELNNRNELLVPAKVLGQGVGSSFQMPAVGNPELIAGGTNEDYKEPAYIDCKITGIEAPDLSLFDFDKNEK